MVASKDKLSSAGVARLSVDFTVGFRTSVAISFGGDEHEDSNPGGAQSGEDDQSLVLVSTNTVFDGAIKVHQGRIGALFGLNDSFEKERAERYQKYGGGPAYGLAGITAAVLNDKRSVELVMAVSRLYASPNLTSTSSSHPTSRTIQLFSPSACFPNLKQQ